MEGKGKGNHVRQGVRGENKRVTTKDGEIFGWRRKPIKGLTKRRREEHCASRKR